jgi:excisionase family DNA binding protein
MKKDEKTLTIPEAARLLRISSLKAYQYARRGQIPSVRIGPRTIRVPKAALDDFLAGGPVVVKQGSGP